MMIIIQDQQNIMSFSSFQPKGTDIKKGLEKIKQAQIEVLRQLKKEEEDASRNYSLTFSKQTTFDSNMNFKHDFELRLVKEKLQKLQFEAKQFQNRQQKQKRQIARLTEETKRTRQAELSANQKMKEYERNVEFSLSKAQEALANAIQSEKRYIKVKSETEKILKQKQRLVDQLREMQKKQICNLGNSKSIDQLQEIFNKVVTQFAQLYKNTTKIINQVNNHRCKIKKDSHKSNQSSGSYQFTISTFQIQGKIDHSIKNITKYLGNLQHFHPIQKDNLCNRQRIAKNERDDFDSEYISLSFHQDIKKIAMELDQAQKGKYEAIKQLEKDKRQLTKKISQMEEGCRISESTVEHLRKKIKNLQEQMENQIKRRKIMEQQLIAKNKQLKREKQEVLKQYQKLKHTEKDTDETKFDFCMVNELENQNKNLFNKVGQIQKENASLRQMIDKLKIQLDRQILARGSLQSKIQFLNQKNRFMILQNKSNLTSVINQQEWDQMIRLVTKLQQEKSAWRKIENELRSSLAQQAQKNLKTIKILQEQHLKQQGKIEQLREQVSAFSYNQTDLEVLRNNELKRNEGYLYNENIETLWKKKQTQYQKLRSVLQINGKLKEELEKTNERQKTKIVKSVDKRQDKQQKINKMKTNSNGNSMIGYQQAANQNYQIFQAQHQHQHNLQQQQQQQQQHHLQQQQQQILGQKIQHKYNLSFPHKTDIQKSSFRVIKESQRVHYPIANKNEYFIKLG